jgi:hypothetical protein
VGGCSTDSFLAPDGSVLDASFDAGDSAPIEGGEGGDACTPSTPLCPEGALCTNFDIGPGFYGPFNPTPTTNNARAAIEVLSDLFVSCPNGLAASLTNPETLDVAMVTASQAFPMTAHASIAVDMWLNKSSGAFTFLRLSAGNTSHVSFGVDTTGGWYLFAEASGASKTVAMPPISQWIHVVLDVSFDSASSTTSTLTYGVLGSSNENVTTLTGATLGVGVTPTTLTAYVGMGTGTGTTSADTGSAHYDDVVFTPN